MQRLLLVASCQHMLARELYKMPSRVYYCRCKRDDSLHLCDYAFD